MPTQIIKWTCNTCHSEYQREKQAAACELKGLPADTAHIKEGDVIKFTRNVAGPTNEIATFVSGEGKVLHVITLLNEKSNMHHQIFVVETENDLGHYEGVCAMHEINGSQEMYLNATPRYNLGYAETLKKGVAND